MYVYVCMILYFWEWLVSLSLSELMCELRMWVNAGMVCVCVCVCVCVWTCRQLQRTGENKGVNSHCWSWESPQEVSLAHECFRVDGQTTSLVPDVASPGAGPASSWSQGWLQCAFLDPRPVSLGSYSQSSIWKLPLISSCPENPSSIDSLHLQAPACFAKGGMVLLPSRKQPRVASV